MSNDNQKPPQKTGWTKVTKSEYVEQMLPLYKKHRHSNKGSWTAAKKTQPNENVTQQTIIGSKAQKTMNDLQQKLKSVMPAIHEAKQFALTIDTETIRAEREGRTEFSGELTVFGNPIHTLIQTIETNSKAVRENTEKKDFTKAMECIEICELSAAQVLGYQSEWERLLKRFQQTPPERLLGESPDQAQIDFERLLEREREAIEKVIPQTITECKVLRESQYKVKDQFESCLDLQQLKDFPNALQRLQSTIQNVRQFSVLQLGWDGFAAQRRKRERLYQQLQKTPTRDRRAEGVKKEALGLWNVANSEADRAEFETAIQNLEKMEELACLVVSGGGVAALSYDQDYANVMPVVEQALSIKCPCETIRKEQEELTSLRDEFLSAASNHDYSSADYSMGIASSKASHIIELAQRWEACDRSRESQRRLLEVAISMNPGNRSDLQQQVQAKCDQGNANLDNALFKEALEEYSEAHRLAISLLSQAGPQHMSEYYQDLEQYSDLFRQAESVKPIYGPVSKPKKEFIDAKSKMESSEKMADYSGALQMHGIALTRAFDVVKNGELQTLYERDRLAFRPRFEACRKLDRKLPGVEEGLRQLTIALQSMQLAAGTDLAKARVLIKDAVKITNRLLAFKDTTDRQNSKHKDLTQIIDSVNKSYLNPGTAQQYEKQGPGDGDQKLFGDYIQALRESEINRRDPQTFEASLNLLEKAAKAYLDTCPKPYSKPAQNCLATLIQVRQLRLVKEFDQIGVPPWNMLQESRASSLQAKIVFEQGYVKGEAEASTQGVNGSFWLKNVAWGDTQEGNKLAKQLFFKPGALEDLPLMPKGGAAPREALSFTFAEQLKAQTGLDFQTPETLLISVDQSMLELSGEQSKKLKKAPGQLIGSVQVFAKSRGDLKSLQLNDPLINQKISPKSTQKTALFDIISLQMDRHHGNVMVGEPDESGNYSLIPIDHGLGFPSKQLAGQRNLLAFRNNQLRDLPGSDEKFSEEMQACIELLDPEAIALNLQKSLEDMWQLQDVDPSTLPTEESVLMSKRSAQFLKFAAKELKVKEIFDALAVDNLNILTCSDNEMETVFQKAIYRVKERSIAREEYERWTESEWLNAYKKLYSLGWCTDVWDYSFKPIPFIDWMNCNGPLALKLLKGNTENPAARQEIENELNRQNRPTDLVNKLKGKNLGEQVALIRLAAQNSISTSATSSELKDIETLAQKLGFNSIDKKTGEILYEALQLFGKKAFDKCSLAKEESSDDERRDVVCRSILNEVSKGSPTPYTNQLKLEYPNLNWETLEDYTLNVAYVDKLKQLEQKVGLTFAEFEARESIENKFIKTIKDLVVWMERWLEYVAWGGDDRLGQGGFDASHATHFSLRYPLMVSIKRDENAMLALEKQEQMK